MTAPARMAGLGGKRFLADLSVNGEVAPIPAVRGTEIERQGSTLKHTCRNRVRWSFNRAIDKRNAAFPTRRRSAG